MADDATLLREHMLLFWGTDYGASDDELAAYAREAKARVAARADGTGWLSEASRAMRLAWAGPRREGGS